MEKLSIRKAAIPVIRFIVKSLSGKPFEYLKYCTKSAIPANKPTTPEAQRNIVVAFTVSMRMTAENIISLRPSG